MHLSSFSIVAIILLVQLLMLPVKAGVIAGSADKNSDRGAGGSRKDDHSDKYDKSPHRDGDDKSPRRDKDDKSPRRDGDDFKSSHEHKSDDRRPPTNDDHSDKKKASNAIRISVSYGTNLTSIPSSEAIELGYLVYQFDKAYDFHARLRENMRCDFIDMKNKKKEDKNPDYERCESGSELTGVRLRVDFSIGGSGVCRNEHSKDQWRHTVEDSIRSHSKLPVTIRYTNGAIKVLMLTFCSAKIDENEDHDDASKMFTTRATGR